MGGYGAQEGAMGCCSGLMGCCEVLWGSIWSVGCYGSLWGLWGAMGCPDPMLLVKSKALTCTMEPTAPHSTPWEHSWETHSGPQGPMGAL